MEKKRREKEIREEMKMRKKTKSKEEKEPRRIRTRPSRPIRCDVWIDERMRYPTNRRTQPVIEVLCRT